MNFENVLFQQPYNIRKQVRNIETHEKKLIEAKMAVVFNNTCINENLLPTYTKQQVDISNNKIYTHLHIYARLKQIQVQIIFANQKYPRGFDKVVSSCSLFRQSLGVNVKIISHARGSSHERATQDGLRFCTLHESLLSRGDCILPISSCLVQVRKNISLFVSSMVIKVILIK